MLLIICACVCVGIQSKLIKQFTKKPSHQNDKDNISEPKTGRSDIIVSWLKCFGTSFLF